VSAYLLSFTDTGLDIGDFRLSKRDKAFKDLGNKVLLLENTRAKAYVLLINGENKPDEAALADAIGIFNTASDVRGVSLQLFRLSTKAMDYAAQALKRSNSSVIEDKQGFIEFREVVQRAYLAGASDIRFSTVGDKAKILFRIDGDIQPDTAKLDIGKSTVEPMLRAAFARSEENSNSSSQLEFNLYQSTTVAVDVKDKTGEVRRIFLRMQSDPQRGGHVNVCRLLMQRDRNDRTKGPIAPLADQLVGLGFMPDQAHEIAVRSRQGSGAGLSVGETGSGKTNTSYTVCASLAVPTKAGHTIEDPIEGTIFGVNQHGIQVREGQTRAQAFEEAFTALLRSDPDFILIGEIRDAAGGQAFLDSSDAGHYTISTLHAESSIGAYRRLTSRLIGLPIEVITAPGFISWIAHHKLLQVLCDHCKLPFDEAKANFDDPGYLFGIEEVGLMEKYIGEPERLYFRNPVGCPHCRARTPGVNGRTLTAGVLFPDDVLLDLIQRARYREAISEQRGRWLGSKKLSDALLKQDFTSKSGMEVALFKMLQGKIDPREVIGAHQHFNPYLRSLGVLK
jgi:type II secretory ATPase GspE/PulE/Tfp pilus assembly ATPase PilB-like protein